MDLTQWLLRRALPRPFVVTALGGTGARLAVERVLRERGWHQALSPADADLLVVCGPDDPALVEAVDRVWRQVPGPRARVRVVDAAEAADRLDRARAELGDVPAQRRAAVARAGEPEETRSPHDGGEQREHAAHQDTGQGGHEGSDGPDAADHQDGGHPPEHGEGHAEHGGGDGQGNHADHGEHTDHGEHAEHGEHGEHGEHAEHGDGGGHDHHMHGGMDLPGGLPMAQRGADRDGLKLDRLHVALGPVLPDWPSGLLVRLVVQGDVVQEAETAVLGEPDGTPFWDTPVCDEHGVPDWPRTRAAAAADSLHRLLAVAGWSDAALALRRLRDTLLAPEPWRPHPYLARWVRRIRRSRALRWTTDHTGVIGEERCAALRGDATARWLRWLDEVAAVALPGTHPPPRRESGPLGAQRAERAHRALELLPKLLVGRELAAARLTVASLDPDLEALAARTPEKTRG